MVGLGICIQRLASGYTGFLFKLSAVIIIILGLSMVNRGLTLGGIQTASFTSPPVVNQATHLEAPPAKPDKTIPFTAPPAAQDKVRSGEPSELRIIPDNVIFLVADQHGFSPLELHAVKNETVKIVISARELNGCNTIFMIPALNIKRTLVPGENVITLPPRNTDLVFTCGMGMIKGKIIFH